MSYYMGAIAGTVQRFFHPAAIDQMLETLVPLINGTDLNVCLGSAVASASVDRSVLNFDFRVYYRRNFSC
jgi:hypothetical protein